MDETASDTRFKDPSLLTFVTVTFAAEMPLLHLQLDSMRRFLDPVQVAEIIVIHNEVRPLSQRALKRLRQRSGWLGDRLRVLEAREVAELPPTIGWRSQQILKLEIARQVRTPMYVLLDAKNHLVRPARPTDLVVSETQARGGNHSYESHPLKPLLILTLDLFQLSREGVDDFPATATPFVMHTGVVLDLLHGFTKPGDATFGESFERAGVSEFFLYSAWIQFRGMDAAGLYDGTPIQSTIIWSGACTAADVTRATAEAIELDVPYFAVHRRALGRMRASARRALAAYWHDRGLFDDASAANRFIFRFWVTYYPAMVLKKFKDSRALPLKGR